MARRRKPKQQNIKADDNRLRPRDPFATRTNQARKAGSHGDPRKEESRRACRGRVEQGDE